jgi:hypothetical protein
MTPSANLLALSLTTVSLALALPAHAESELAPSEPVPSEATHSPKESTQAPASTEKSKRLPQELNINLFRNPSMGLEYRLGAFSVHGGAYPTVISQNAAGENETSWFIRAGLSAYFLGHSFYGQRESEFYVSASYMRGLNLGHENGAAIDVGYRWMVWRGLNVRLGVAVLLEPGREVHVNPTPGIGWSFPF